MSVSHIPEKVKIRLWGKAAGRCQYEGCNKPLWLDSHTKAECNLNIPRYVDTLEKEEYIDIPAVQEEIQAIEAELAATQTELNRYLKELGMKVNVVQGRRN